MTNYDYHQWLVARMSELDSIDLVPTYGEEHAARCGTIAWKAGDTAARLGLPTLFNRSRDFGALCDADPVKGFLAECLAACQIINGEQALMTEDEAIAYLRLNIDDRDPAERLRNLVRRQRLPMVKRGKLRLFRRSAVNSWLDWRK